MKHKLKGWTLVETMIVIAIVGLLAAIAIPNFIKAKYMDEVNKQHPEYSEVQRRKLADARMQAGDHFLELDLGAGKISVTPDPVTRPYTTQDTSPKSKFFNGVVTEKAIINNLNGGRLFTVSVVETNVYQVTEEDYFRSMVGSKPQFNKN